MIETENKEGLILKYFVLKPKGNSIYAEASRKAILSYARYITKVNPQFAKDLKLWVKREFLLTQQPLKQRRPK